MGKIFISYRRVDSDFTHRLSEKLQAQIAGTVFIDRDIAEDDFERALLRQVRECNVFVLILTEHTLAEERIFQQDDWVRREIALALELEKPVALAMYKGFAPPHPSKLPGNIATITTKQGISFYPDFFDQSVEKLAKHCVAISNGGLQVPVAATNRVEPQAFVSQQGERNTYVKQEHVTVSGNLHIGDQIIPEKLDARAVIDTLKEQRQTLETKLNSFGHKERDTRKAEFSCAFVILFFFGVISVVSSNQLLGIVAFTTIPIWIGWRYWTTNKQKTERMQLVAQLRQQILDVDQKIQDQRKLITK